ncbi:MAG TPA: TusE/DsrC/DsvC family sulfur relay protein [Nitriliruptoraceae bacterium]|nr:TusE/DsrC/DsvC family sulfur relay protein [Nitriliruptoraceae bacterium]
MIAQIDGRDVHVDEEGFLTEYDDWDEALAATLAGNIGLALTDRHMEVVSFLRRDYVDQGETPTLRRVTATGGFPTRELFKLFPGKPAKKMSYVAGLPKPVGCV